MSAETLDGPPVLLGDENPWNRLRYGERVPPADATEGIALFPSDLTPDGVEERPVWVLSVFEGFDAAVVRTKAGGLDHYLSLARVASATTLARKREAYAASLACTPRRKAA